MLTRKQLTEFRDAANQPKAHVFTAGLIGGICHACGSNSGNRHPCHKKSQVTVDRSVFLELLDLAAQAMAERGDD